MATSGVYWVGQDGNYYINTSTSKGVKNLGYAGVTNPNMAVINGLSRIDDPVNPQTKSVGADSAAPLPSAPSKQNGLTDPNASTGPTYTDTSAARAATQSGIDSLDGILNNKLAQAQGEYDTVLQGYNDEDALNQTNYDKQVSSNEGTREAQHQAALLAAANGGRGLYSTLASLGALGGTGKLLANRAVSGEANVDIGNANKTFDTNAGTLFDSFSKVKQQEDQRRKDAENTLRQTQQQNRYDVTSQRQSMLKDMADLWTKAGNNGQSATALGKASALNADLVANTRPNVSAYAKAPVQFSAPALGSYLAGANDMSVNTTPAAGGLPINGAIYTSTKKRDAAVA